MMIRFNHDIFQIVEFLHVKPGKGAAFVRTKLKSVTSGKVLDNTFPSGAKLEEVRVEHRTYQFLYSDGEQFHFQDLETFEQLPVSEHLINAPEFLADGMECEVIVNADEEIVLGVEIPNFVVLEVTYTEPGLKGDTATNTLKPAKVGENEVEIRVPLFVGTGEKIRIDTRTRAYMERVK